MTGVSFNELMGKINEVYAHNPNVGYSSGVGNDEEKLYNPPGTNAGSCKIFYFAQMHGLSEESTLRLFCEHYESVLLDPSGTSHQNIRNFMNNGGWEGIKFEGEVLLPKGSESAAKIDQI